jgi:hypothetical protein
LYSIKEKTIIAIRKESKTDFLFNSEMFDTSVLDSSINLFLSSSTNSMCIVLNSIFDHRHEIVIDKLISIEKTLKCNKCIKECEMLLCCDTCMFSKCIMCVKEELNNDDEHNCSNCKE